MSQKIGKSGNREICWRGLLSIEKALDFKSSFFECNGFRVSKCIGLLSKNKTKDARWFDSEDFGSRLLSFVTKYTEIIVIERHFLFWITFNRRIMDV